LSVLFALQNRKATSFVDCFLDGHEMLFDEVIDAAVKAGHVELGHSGLIFGAERAGEGKNGCCDDVLAFDLSDRDAETVMLDFVPSCLNLFCGLCSEDELASAHGNSGCLVVLFGGT